MNLTWMTSILAIALVVSIAASIAARIWRHRAGVAHGILWSGLVLMVFSPLVSTVVSKAFEFEVTMFASGFVGSEKSTAQVHDRPLQIQQHSVAIADPKQKPQGKVIPADMMESNPIPKSDPSPQSTGSARPENAASRVSIFAVAFWFWVAVTGLLLIRLAVQFASVLVVFGKPLDCKSEMLLAAFGSAKKRVPGTDDVRMKRGKVVTPVAMNFPARQVIVPVDFELQMTHDSARRILIHELAHVRRHDQIALLLQRFVTCFVWPFVPVHFLNRAICQTREDLCDNYVDQDESLEYCKDLLQLTLLPNKTVKPQPCLALVPGLFSRRNLEHRIGGILSESRIFEKQTRLPFLAVSFIALIASATAVASIGFVPDGANRYVTKYESKPGTGCDIQPLFRSIRLSEDSPLNLKVKVAENENANAETIQFAEIRYGSAASDQVSLALVRENSKDSAKSNLRLYLDRNRDRVIEDDEQVDRLVENGKTLWRCKLDCLIQNSADEKRSIKLQREVAFRSGVLDDRIGFATIGFMEGAVNIDGSEKQLRRMDADGNGLFSDQSDRLWIDLNENEEWEIDEQFKLKPIMLVRNSRFRVRADSQNAIFQMLPVEDTGTVRLGLPLDDQTAKIERLQVTFSGDNGFGFTVSGTEPNGT